MSLQWDYEKHWWKKEPSWKKYFEYKDGDLFWKKSFKKYGISKGDEAKDICAAHLQARISLAPICGGENRKVLRARVVYEMFHGPQGKGAVFGKYINDPKNDMIENLYLK